MNFKKWKYLKNENYKFACNNPNGSDSEIYGSDYRGCCSRCMFIHGRYGDHWTSDKVWCSCPVTLEYNQTVRIVEIKKYKFIKEAKLCGQ